MNLFRAELDERGGISTIIIKRVRAEDKGVYRLSDFLKTFNKTLKILKLKSVKYFYPKGKKNFSLFFAYIFIRQFALRKKKNVQRKQFLNL